MHSLLKLALMLAYLLLVNNIGQSEADIYLHYPRGSNNRLNERSANRANANRLFDSQNNNRGGYNVGQLDNGQFVEKYFYGSPDSRLNIEWTMQHGCRDGRQRCRIVIQAMCEPLTAAAAGNSQPIRNGNTTSTQDYQPVAGDAEAETSAQHDARRAASLKLDRGLHEPFEWYDYCYQRQRNKGLFTADQTLRGESAIYTRQNPNGARRGYECPEERDYYPYWVPTPWLDLAVLTDNSSECQQLQHNSQQTVGACVRPFVDDNNRRRWSIVDNNRHDCAKHNGEFREFFANYLEIDATAGTAAACQAKGYRWAIPYRHNLHTLRPACLVPAPPPVCKLAPMTRDNHLGDADASAGSESAFTWQLPDFPSRHPQRCVLRLRYNLTSTDANQQLLKQNPLINPGLRLRIDTNQVGRVFQDRSHEFHLLPQPIRSSSTLHHVGVRGKRGNIVQTYPAVEYDFTPTQLTGRVGDLLFLQWSGANTHNNRQPAGDGQAGDDGAGAGGSDRSNWVEAANASVNYPLVWEASRFLRLGHGRVVWAWHGANGLQPRDYAISLASSGHYRCFEASSCGRFSVEQMPTPDVNLNDAPASFPGIMIELMKPGVFDFLCTRNNNFSNRSHKMRLIVQ